MILDCQPRTSDWTSVHDYKDAERADPVWACSPVHVQIDLVCQRRSVQASQCFAIHWQPDE